MHKRSAFFTYSFLFLGTALAVFFPFLLLGKGFLRFDGIAQHLTALTYWGQYLRSFVSGLCHGHVIAPQFDPALGFGADILTTLHYYVIGEPINFLSVFVPEQGTIYLYHFLVLLRLYLAGLSFLIYCSYHDFDRQATMVGSLIYTFCGFALYCAPRHPFFCTPLIYLPLLCLGIDRYFQERNPHTLVLSTFLAEISNFYFFYMLAILVVLYATVRYFFIKRTKGNGDFIHLFTKTALWFLLGMAMGMCILLPNALAFLASSRNQEIVNVPFVYKPIYYIKLFLSPVGMPQFFSYSFLGFAATAFLLVLPCFSRTDHVALQIKIFLGISFLFLCFPVFAHVFNGFNYLTNRWCFAVAFPVAIACVYALPTFSKAPRWIFIIAIGMSLLVLGVSCISGKTRTQYALTYLCLLIVSVFLRITQKKSLYRPWMLLDLTIVSIIVNAWERYMPWGLDYLATFSNPKVVQREYYYNELNKLLPSFPRDEQYRLETPQINGNMPAILHVPSDTYYWSMSPGSLPEAYGNLAIATGGEMSCGGLSKYPFLRTLMGIRYQITSDQTTDSYPWHNYYITEHTEALPLAFAYHSQITKNEYNQLSPLAKQEALLQGLVMNDGTIWENMETVKPDIHIRQIPYTLQPDQQIEQKGAGYRTKKANTGFSLSMTPFEMKEDEQVFVTFTGLSCSLDDKADFVISNGIDEPQGGQIRPGRGTFGHTFTYNMGTHPTQNIHVAFEDKATYRYDDLRVELVSTQALKKTASALQHDGLQDTSFSSDQITGSIEMATPGVLVFSIPYTKGWSASVDGEDTKIYRVQESLMGIYLDEGLHTIIMRYRTPGLRIGWFITAIAWMIFIALSLRDSKRRKK